MENYLTDEEYWDRNREFFESFIVEDVPLSKEFEKILPKDNLDFLEIGGYPGTYAVYFSKKFGYKPSIIDYTSHPENIRNLLKVNNIDNYQFYNEDFLKASIGEFDVVASFGFIEHFDDYERVIKKHFEIVRNGGFVIISVPVFSLFQKIARKLLFKKEYYRELKATHNFQIMNRRNLKRTISKYSNKFLFVDHVLKSEIWFSYNDERIRTNKRILAKMFIKVSNVFSRILPSNRFTSPMLLIITKK